MRAINTGAHSENPEIPCGPGGRRIGMGWQEMIANGTRLLFSTHILSGIQVVGALPAFKKDTLLKLMHVPGALGPS